MVPLAQRSWRRCTGFTLSVGPSICPWTGSCQLCIFNNTCCIWIMKCLCNGFQIQGARPLPFFYFVSFYTGNPHPHPHTLPPDPPPTPHPTTTTTTSLDHDKIGPKTSPEPHRGITINIIGILDFSNYYLSLLLVTPVAGRLTLHSCYCTYPEFGIVPHVLAHFMCHHELWSTSVSFLSQ